MNPTNIIEQLKRDEGFKLTAYKDSMGIWTIGCGHNLEAHPPFVATCTQEQAEAWMYADIQRAKNLLKAYVPWTENIGDARYHVLVNMCFNMGINKLLAFRRTLGLIKLGMYDAAAAEMLNSAWATQVGDRAKRLSEQMLTGAWR